jgi:GTP-binding protein Era
VSEPFGAGDRFVAQALHKAGKPVILGLNKIDLIAKPKLLPLIDSYRQLMEFAEVIPLSALSGENTELVAERLLAQLPQGERLYPEDFLTDLPERFFVGEMVREAILHHTRDEIPYVTGVVVESFKEEEGLVRIEASIFVERDSQKGILIGRGGSMLKAVGTQARHQIEAFLASKVFLGLFVKVREHWREDPGLLEDMGLGKR